MLRKLLKYEGKATLRIFLPLYGALIVFAALNKAFFSLDFLSSLLGGVPQTLSMVVYVALCAGILAFSLIIGLQRFHRNLLGNEGYLMHTLPTPTWKLLVSKLLFATIWSVISLFLVIACSLFMGLTFAELAKLPENIGIALRLSSGLLGINLALVFLEIVGVAALNIAFLFTMTYASMSVGQLFNRHRTFLSFVAFGAFWLLLQLIIGWVMYIVTRIDPFIFYVDNSTPMTIIHSVCGILAGISLLFGSIFFTLSNWLLKRHLNLLGG